MAKHNVRIKRVYAIPDGSDGRRILVDRLWPRGLTKDKAKVDLWLKDISPSTELRKWFGHDPKRWTQFKRRYLEELNTLAGPLDVLRLQLAQGPVTLLYGAKDGEHNEAAILLELLQ